MCYFFLCPVIPRILCTNDLIVLHPLGIFFFFFFFSEKNPVCRDRTHVLTCQKVTWLTLSYRGDRLAVQQVIAQKNILPFKTRIMPHLQMPGRAGLTPARCAGKSRSSRLQIVLATKSLRGVLAIKLLAPLSSLTSIYPRSFHSLVPPNFDGSLEPAWLRGNSDQPQYVRHNGLSVFCFS